MSNVYTDNKAAPIANNKDSATNPPSVRSIVIAMTLVASLVSPSLMSVGHAGPPLEIRVSTTAPIMAATTTYARTPSVLFNVVPVIAATAEYEGVVRVDEDWELRITEPDTAVAAPQVGTVMAPTQSLDGYFVTFLLNHRFNPQLALGGMEVQFWYGDLQLGTRREDKAVLDHSNDTVTWTQRLMIKGEPGSRYLCYRIVNGQSASWGPFGGTEPLHMNTDTSLTDLSGYSSEFSVRNSGVTFASNRVATLVLKAVRGYSEAGALIFEETTPVVVYSLQP